MGCLFGDLHSERRFLLFHSGEHATPPCFLDDPISVLPIPIDRPTPLDFKERD